MKKFLFFLSAVVMLIVVCVQTNSSSTDLLLENVEALSAGEVHLGYKRTTGPCPQLMLINDGFVVLLVVILKNVYQVIVSYEESIIRFIKSLCMYSSMYRESFCYRV